MKRALVLFVAIVVAACSGSTTTSAPTATLAPAQTPASVSTAAAVQSAVAAAASANIETAKIQGLTHCLFKLPVPVRTAEHDKLDHGTGSILFALSLI